MKIRLYTLFLLFFAVAAIGADTSCNVYFNLADFSLRPTAVNNVTLTPLAVPGSYNGKVLDAQAITKATDINGSVTFSNVVAGYPYQVLLSRVGTTFQIVLPVALTGTVNGHDYIGNFAGQFFQYYYTSNLLAASFDPLGSAQQATNTIAAPAIVGLVTSNQIATINPSQIYPAVAVSGGQTNWSVGAITNAGNLAYSNATDYQLWVTNGLATINYVNGVSNGVYGQIPTSIITNNYTGNLSFNSTIQLNGPVTVSNAVTSYSGSTTNPAPYEFVTQQYVQNLLNSGQILYGTSNTIATGGITNTINGVQNTVSLIFSNAASLAYVKAFTFASGDVGNYFATIITTNKFQSISGPIVSSYYLTLNTGAGHALTIAPDVFITYDLTNLVLISSGAGQSIVVGNTVTNLYTWTSSAAQYNSTNAAGFYIVRRTKCIAQVGAPTLWVSGGGANTTTLAFNSSVGSSGNYSGTFTGNGAGLTNLSLPYTSITNSPWITTNAFTSLISSSNFVKATVTNGLTGNSNNFYGTFGTIVQPVYSTTTSLVVSGITNSISPALILTNFNGTYYWSNTLSIQGLWVKGSTNFFGYVTGSGSSPGWGFTTNYLVDTTYIVDNFGVYWGTTNGTTSSSSGFTGSKSPIQFYFTGGVSPDQNVEFTLPVSSAAATNLFTPTAISLMAASGNTNLLISNNDPWFTTDKNPTLDVSGSVDQALVVKGSFYVTGTLNGNGGGLTNLPSSTPAGVLTNNYTASIVVTNAGVATIIRSNSVNATSYLIPAISNNVVPSANGYSISTANLNTNIIILSGAGIATANGNYYWSSLTNAWTNNTSSPFTIVVSTNTLATNALAAISNTVYTTSRSTNLATYVGPSSGVGLWTNGLNPSYTNLSTAPVSSWNYTNGGLMNVTFSSDGTNQVTPMTLSSNVVTINSLKINTGTNSGIGGIIFPDSIVIGGKNNSALSGGYNANYGNIAIGSGAGNSVNSVYNGVIIGNNAGAGLYSAGSSGPVIIGNNAATSSSTFNAMNGCVAIGDGAATSFNGPNSVAIGESAGFSVSSGQYSVLIGSAAGKYSSNSKGCVAIGYAAGTSQGTLNNNYYGTFIGQGAGAISFLSNSGSNSICIGAYTPPPTNNSINIGNTIYGNILTSSITIPGSVTATNGFVLNQLSAIPTNSISSPSSTTTNWVLLNLTGNAYLVATNTTSGGWLYQKLTSSITTTP